jgi:hypothetical protein
MDYEGRYYVDEAFRYYTIERHGMGAKDARIPAWGILDEEAGGYIAFTTDEEAANKIVDALRATERSAV